MRNSTLLILAALSLSLLNTACGLKAPLYLPEEKAEQVPTEPGTNKRRVNNPGPAPQGPKQDRIDATKPGQQTVPTPPSDPDRPASPPPGT